MGFIFAQADFFSTKNSRSIHVNISTHIRNASKRDKKILKENILSRVLQTQSVDDNNRYCWDRSCDSKQK